MDLPTDLSNHIACLLESARDWLDLDPGLKVRASRTYEKFCNALPFLQNDPRMGADYLFAALNEALFEVGFRDPVTHHILLVLSELLAIIILGEVSEGSLDRVSRENELSMRMQALHWISACRVQAELFPNLESRLAGPPPPAPDVVQYYEGNKLALDTLVEQHWNGR